MTALEGSRTEPTLYAAIEKISEEADGTIKVYGVASTEGRDNDGEVIKASAIRGAIPEYMKFPAIREMHQLSAAGKALEVGVDDDGVTRVVAHVVDPAAVAKVKAKVYNGFSIGGRALERDMHDRKTITKMSMHEISLVDRPCNPEAVFDLWKAEGGTYGEPANAASGINNYDLEGPHSTTGRKDSNTVDAPKDDGAVKPEVEKRDFSQKERDDAAASGAAMDDGSYPIKNQEDLNNAVRLRGKGKKSKSAVEAHIRSRAKALGLKVPEMDDTEKTEKAAGNDLSMADILRLRDIHGDLSMSELIAKAATETTPPDGSAQPVTDAKHSSNDTGTGSRVNTEAERPEGHTMAVEPNDPSLQSTNQNFGAPVKANTGGMPDRDGGVEGNSSVPASGPGAAGEDSGYPMRKGMHSMSCLASILCDIKCLLVSQRWEEAMEDEDSDVITQMETWLKQGATLLGSVVSKEVQELLEEARVDPGDAMGMIELVTKAIKTMEKTRRSATKHQPVDADMGKPNDEDVEDSDMSKVAGAGRHPDDLKKISSLEARIAELEAKPADNKSIAGTATAITKAQDTVSGYHQPGPDDEALLKAWSEMPAEEQRQMMFKTILSNPTRVGPPA